MVFWWKLNNYANHTSVTHYAKVYSWICSWIFFADVLSVAAVSVAEDIVLTVDIYKWVELSMRGEKKLEKQPSTI